MGAEGLPKTKGLKYLRSFLLVMLTLKEREHRPAQPLWAGIEQIEELIRVLRKKLRDLWLRAALFARPCPECGKPSLRMLRDSWCKCEDCGHEFDPTLLFQECPRCRGPLTRQIFHYWCGKCRERVRSAFCFDTKVFDAAYFREMMRDSRERKRRKREQLRQILANCRSGQYLPEEEPLLTAVPGLQDVLNTFIAAPLPAGSIREFSLREPFDMQRYRQHILDVVSGCVVHFEGIAQLIGDLRLDRVYRFITVVFMQQRGEVVLEQHGGGDILVHENETQREGQAVC